MFGVEGLTGSLLFTIVVAAFGSAFQHGYNTGVLNAPQEVIESWIRSALQSSYGSKELPSQIQTQVTAIFSVIGAIYCFGGFVGGLLTNVWVNTFGRKWGIIANNIWVFISAALMGFAKPQNSYLMLIAGRFFNGINSGLNAGLVPMYLSEIPPIPLRGGVGSVYQLFLTISIMLSQILSSSGVLGTDRDWPLLVSVVIVIPAIIQIVLLPICADSPRYLQTFKGEAEAKKALIWFRGTDKVDTEIAELKRETDIEKNLPDVGINDLLSNPMLRKPMLISCIIMLAQQFSGINAVIFYSTSTFKVAKLSDSSAELGTIILGVMNVLMTVISTLIVDKAGRKTLLTIGFGTMFIDTVALCICLTLAFRLDSIPASYFSIALVVMFVVFFAIGPGSIPWFLVSELFLQNARPKAISIAVATNWLANFFVVIAFPSLQLVLTSYVFIIFALLQLAFVIYIIIVVPETKNRSVADITAEFMPATEKPVVK